ncbi:MAG: glycosyltransferase [Candidatus Omnitrophota bacterium]|jgi:spore maturation protein CgeB
MRIFIAVRHALDPKFYYGSLWSSNFYPALRQLGHEIIESSVDLLPASSFMQVAVNFTPEQRKVRQRITEQIIGELAAAHQEKPVDLFLSYFYNAHFEPGGFAQIHKLGVKTVNFFCNSIYQFELVSEIAKKVNFAWHPERAARELYLKAGANPVRVQLGADPQIYRPHPEISRQAKACFLGQRYADRDRHLAELIAAGVPVDIYGTGWEKPSQPKAGSLSAYLSVFSDNIKKNGVFKGLQRTLAQFYYRRSSRKLDSLFASRGRGFTDDISRTFAAYEVILNFSNVWSDSRPGSKLLAHVRLRDFEAPMCRTCYLTGYSDEIGEFYHPGKEIDTYRTPGELVEKAKFYLAHPREAEKLRETGYQRALREHTWKERFKLLFQKIGGN